MSSSSSGDEMPPLLELDGAPAAEDSASSSEDSCATALPKLLQGRIVREDGEEDGDEDEELSTSSSSESSDSEAEDCDASAWWRAFFARSGRGSSRSRGCERFAARYATQLAHLPLRDAKALRRIYRAVRLLDTDTEPQHLRPESA